MTEKDEEIYNEIKKYYQENKLMPSIRYLQKKFKYHSTNSIYKHLKSLEKEKFLIRNKKKQLVINYISINDNVREINIINSHKTTKIILEKKKKYCGFILKNDYFQDNRL